MQYDQAYYHILNQGINQPFYKAEKYFVWNVLAPSNRSNDEKLQMSWHWLNATSVG